MTVRREFAAFVAISAFAAGVNFAARFPIQLVTGFEAAVVLAYAIGMTTAFLLNRQFVFRPADDNWRRQYWRFFLVNMVALVQVFVVSVVLVRLLPALGMTWYHEAVAHALGLASPILTSFWGHKKYSFASGASPGTDAR